MQCSVDVGGCHVLSVGISYGVGSDAADLQGVVDPRVSPVKPWTQNGYSVGNSKCDRRKMSC